MKAPLLIVMGVVVLVAGSGLAIMNNACKAAITDGALQSSDTGGRHQAPAHLIIPDNDQQAAMQDDELFA
jgi:hypothetical protein